MNKEELKKVAERIVTNERVILNKHSKKEDKEIAQKKIVELADLFIKQALDQSGAVKDSDTDLLTELSLLDEVVQELLSAKS